MAIGEQRTVQQRTGDLAKVLTFSAILLFMVVGWLWWKNVSIAPKRVFDGMLENSLRTRSISKTVVQSNGEQELNQRLQIQMGEKAIARSISVLTQGSENSTAVTTESIGTTAEDYVRYTDIKTTQNSIDGQPLKFDKVLGIWGKSQTGADNAGGTTGGQLFGEAVLGVVPIGELPHEARARVLNFIRDKNVYDIDYSKIKKEKVAGRTTYIYPVSVEPEIYVTMLKQFGKEVGLKQLEAFEPSTFRGSPLLEFEIFVDVLSKQLVGVKFPGSTRTENYGSYGVYSDVAIPNETIPVEELQTRLQSVQ